MAVVHFSLIVEYAMGERPQEENFARTQDLMARLCKIHPLLSTISPQGKAGSWQRMESEPLLQNITFEQWLAYYAHRSLDMPVSLGATINYWNRHRSKGTYTLIQCLYNSLNADRRNDSMIKPLPPDLFKPALLPQIMAAFIEAFDGVWGQYSWVDSDAQPRWQHYQVWVREDQPEPALGESVRFPDDGHPPLPAPTSWHDGRLFTWPEHAPWELLKRYDKYPQP
jgi:hypothetical protein